MTQTTRFETLAKNPDIKTYLVDAAGVLYNSSGLIPGVLESLSCLRSHHKKVILVTNNTSLSIQGMIDRFKQSGVSFHSTDIISSGLGLAWDPTIHALINQKKVFYCGWPTSAWYIEQAGGIITSSIKNADAIVLLASLKKGHDTIYQTIKSCIQETPEIPVICGNPDHYIWTGDGYYPVIGYYAHKLEQACGITVHWIGKPYPNFSFLVRDILAKQHQIQMDHSVCFFDDNIKNVTQMITDLNILGCWVTDTGLGKGENKATILAKNKPFPHYCIDSIGMDTTPHPTPK